MSSEASSSAAASSSAGAAAAAEAVVSAAPAAAPPAPAPTVQVEEDPTMLEQLQEQEEKAEEIAQLRELLKEHNEENKDALLVQDFDKSDRTAWRFLKARKFDVEKAATMFREAVALRKEQQLDTLLQRPCPKGLEYKVLAKHGWHGFDKHGRPIFIKNTGLQNSHALFSAGTVEERVHYTAYVNEYLRQVIHPEANRRVGGSVNGKYQIDTSVTIVNLANFGWHNIKQANYDWVNALAKVNGLLYPESAGSTWLINAPRVFSMVWSIVKVWLDERTRNKVQILSGDGREQMRAVLGEECFRSLPKAIGGECECMSEVDVPEFGMGCMLGHPMSVQFIRHLQKRNEEAGIANSYTIPSERKEQEEAKQEEKQEEGQEGEDKQTQ